MILKKVSRPLNIFTVLVLTISISVGTAPLSLYAQVATTTGAGEPGTTNGGAGGDAQVPGQFITATSTDGTGGISNQGGTVMTGDATATTTVQNELNTNSADPNAPGMTNSSNITNTNDNGANLGSTASSSATTGTNAADGGTGLSTIVTGNAVSTASVINVVNTNIFNSEGLIVFLNQLFGGGLDLRNYDLSYFFNGPTAASSTSTGGCNNSSGCATGCTILTCLNSSSLNVINTNAATVTNSVLVRASTGENTASSTGSGGADITTGNAYAAANVLNLVNTNLINSSYLLVSFNNFGSLLQDITLPAGDFFKKLFANGGAMPQLNSSTYDVKNTNSTDFTGTSTANALTGANAAITGTTTVTDMDAASSTATTTPGAGAIHTGDAYSMTNSFTQANTDQIGGTSVFLLFRVWGNWTGSVQGLPAGMSWQQTPDGIILKSDNSSSTPGSTLGTYNSSSFLASSTNNAIVKNDVNVYALTGQNETKTESGSSTISTGNAYAAANVVNLVNTNVVGRNWIFAIFNIFGDWAGNISFGKPDLWIGAVANTPNPTPSGTDVTYDFTIKNNGDSDADNVVLKTDFDRSMLALQDMANASVSDTGVSWNLGHIARGETRDFKVTMRAGTPPRDGYAVPMTATVTSSAADNDPVDNTENVTIMVGNPAVINANVGVSNNGGGGGSISPSVIGPVPQYTPDPKITVTKTLSVASTTAPATVDYKVVVYNEKSGGPAYGAVLTDTLYDPTGGVMYNRSWNLDTVAPGDELTLTYSVAFAASTSAGMYKNVAQVTGTKNYSTQGNPMTPVEAARTVQFGNMGQVLGESTVAPESATATNACTTFITTFMSRGLRNNSGDVLRLQQFLNNQLSAGLPLTGTYGPMTEAQVRAFQTRSGIRPASGAVYSLTQGAINSLACGGSVPVAISSPAKTVASTPVKSKIVVAKKPAAKPVAAKPKAPATASKPKVQPTAKKAAPATQPTAAKPAGKVLQWLGNLIPKASAATR